MAVPQRRSVRYAQNFLRSPQLVEYLLNGSSIAPDDLVYEIGPGKGIITERLARRCRQVVAIEKDPALAGELRGRSAGLSNVAVHEADFLDFPLPDTRYKVFASIPFNITTAIVTKLTMPPCAPEEAYLMVQREAAEKFVGQPRESLFAVLLKPWFEPAIIYHFRRGDFAPVPHVDVVMLRLRKRGPPLIGLADRQLFRDFVVYGFTARHRVLRETLAGLFRAHQGHQLGRTVGLGPDAPPSSVRFEQWLVLFHLFTVFGDAHARERVFGAEARLKQQQAGLQKIGRTRAQGRPPSPQV